MNRIQKIAESPNKSYLPVFIDISKDRLDYTIGWQRPSNEAEHGTVAYRLSELEQWITQLVDGQGLSNASQLHFVCEPTGGLQFKLLLMAERYGARVSYVDTERMYNARMITYGNSEKTDQKDPGAMRSLYVLGQHRRVQRREHLQETVRCLSREYDVLCEQTSRLRNRIHNLLNYVFVDYNKSARFTFSRSGQAVAEEFGFCPHQIVPVGYTAFTRRLKAHVPRMRWTTLQQLWAMAERSVAAQPVADPRCDQLQYYYRQWRRLQQRKNQLKAQLGELGSYYREQGWLPKHLPASVKEWMLVRVLAETGSLQEFPHIRALWAYLGMKLARRQSGKYKGQVKITKKGSALARKLLYQICLPLVKPGGCLRGIYQRQNPGGLRGGHGIRAMNCVMRKFVQLIFALHRSGKEFNQDRLSQCESRYRNTQKSKLH
jgi:transposase